MLNTVLGWVGLPQPEWLDNPSLALPSLVVMAAWRNLGTLMVIFLAGLQTIPDEVKEAAQVDGASGWSVFRQITLPLISSALIAGGLLSFTLCLDNTIISSLISGASSTFPVSLVSATKSEIKPFWGVGATVLFVMTMALLAFVANVLRKSGESSSQIAATLGGGG